MEPPLAARVRRSQQERPEVACAAPGGAAELPSVHGAPAPSPSEFGAILRHWRRTRGLSQEELAARVEMSCRHLSFLETGRCGPSRSAVLDLTRALHLSPSETARLLLVAGHAGEWNTGPAGTEPAARHVAKIVHLLDAHEPFPALIIGPDWRVAWANRGGSAFLARLVALNPTLCVEPLDVCQLFADEHWLGRLVTNHHELLQAVVVGLYQLTPDPVSSGRTRALLSTLPCAERPEEAIEQAARTGVWSHPLELRDGDTQLTLEILGLPFAGGVSGFALVLLRVPDGAAPEAAHDYFTRIAALPPR